MKEYNLKNEIDKRLCYTELVYGRINKKLGINLSNEEVQAMIKKNVCNAFKIELVGKNYYIYNDEHNIRITVNKNNYRVITADKLK